MAVAEQRRKLALEALQKANRVRSERSEIKRRIATAQESLVDLLSDVPDHMATAKVEEVLTWMPGVGKVRARKMCQMARVSPTLPLGRIGGHSRAALINEIRERRSSRRRHTTGTGASETTSVESNPLALTG
jgi:hypothetical protein